MSDRYRVLVVEDDAFTRSALAAALRAHGMDVVIEAATAASAVYGFQTAGGDVAVIDLDLGPGPTGIDVALALREHDPSVGIVLLTTFDDPRLLAPDVPALPVGSVYLRKRQVASIAEVREAIERGIRYPGSNHGQAGPRSHNLTDAQFDLLRDIARGLTNAQIAEDAGQTVSAIEKSIRRLSLALGISGTDGNPRALLINAYLQMTGRDVRR